MDSNYNSSTKLSANDFSGGKPQKSGMDTPEHLASTCSALIELLKSRHNVANSLIALGTTCGFLAFHVSKDGKEDLCLESLMNVAKDYIKKHQGETKLEL